MVLWFNLWFILEGTGLLISYLKLTKIKTLILKSQSVFFLNYVFNSHKPKLQSLSILFNPVYLYFLYLLRASQHEGGDCQIGEVACSSGVRKEMKTTVFL